jgi:hypothetical protein
MLLTVPTYRRHSNGEAQTFANVRWSVARRRSSSTSYIWSL